MHREGFTASGPSSTGHGWGESGFPTALKPTQEENGAQVPSQEKEQRKQQSLFTFQLRDRHGERTSGTAELLRRGVGAAKSRPDAAGTEPETPTCIQVPASPFWSGRPCCPARLSSSREARTAAFSPAPRLERIHLKKPPITQTRLQHTCMAESLGGGGGDRNLQAAVSEARASRQTPAASAVCEASEQLRWGFWPLPLQGGRTTQIVWKLKEPQPRLPSLA